MLVSVDRRDVIRYPASSVVELVEEERGVRIVTDRDEEAVCLDLAASRPCTVSVSRTPVTFDVADHLVDDLVEDELDLLVRPRPVDHDRRGTELLATMDEVHLAREAADEHRLLERGVAAADDRHDLCRGRRRASHVAQYETPRPWRRSSESRPSWRALAPVATITLSAVYSSSPTQTRNGRRGEVDAGHVVGDDIRRRIAPPGGGSPGSSQGPCTPSA